MCVSREKRTNNNQDTSQNINISIENDGLTWMGLIPMDIHMLCVLCSSGSVVCV